MIESKIKKNIEVIQFFKDIDDLKIFINEVSFTSDGEIISMKGGSMINIDNLCVCNFEIMPMINNDFNGRHYNINTTDVNFNAFKYIEEIINDIKEKKYNNVSEFTYERIEREKLEKIQEE